MTPTATTGSGSSLGERTKELSHQLGERFFDLIDESHDEIGDDRLLGFADAAHAESDSGFTGTVVVAAAVFKDMSDEEILTFIKLVRNKIESAKSHA